MMTENPSENSPAVVGGMTCLKLFDLPLSIDTYQRGFVWTTDKVQQLVDDLKEYWDKTLNARKKGKSELNYYMGTILLHHDVTEEKNFIIDGQQRLTALCLLYHAINPEERLPKNCNLTYSAKSVPFIQNAYKVLTSSSLKSECGDIFSKIVFTVIKVYRADLAFTFFDTQNNRGVPLHATDLLKAYHLRAIKNKENHQYEDLQNEALQNMCAERWEKSQQGYAVLSLEQEYISSLFTKFLWRARCWRGSSGLLYGGHDQLLDEFQKYTAVPGNDPATIPLYRTRHNRLGTALTMTKDGGNEIITRNISISSKAEDLPFAIRQPIQKGIGFFLYVDKYASLLRWLVYNESTSDEISKFRKVYSDLVCYNSSHFQEIFLLSSLMYADLYGDEKLYEFALWLESALGDIRLKQYSVHYATARNFIAIGTGTLNLLDVIANSFTPEQVIGYLKKCCEENVVHGTWPTDLKLWKGVRKTYLVNMLNYYKKIESIDDLKDKIKWICEILENGTKGGTV